MPHETVGAEGIYGASRTAFEEFSEEEIPLDRMTVAELEALEEEINPLDDKNAVLLLAAALAVFGLLFWLGQAKGMPEGKAFAVLALAGAVALRLVIAALSPGYPTDMACFTGWAKALAENGCPAFYTSGMFADYPPGYLYVLLVTGRLASLLGVDLATAFGGFFVRLPAILLDAALACVLYRAGRKALGERGAMALLLIAAFNPASMLDSAAWGQVDSALTILLVLSFLLLKQQKKLGAAAVFGLAVLVKPQALIAGPVFALGYVFPLLDGGKGRLLKNLADTALGALLALLVIFVGSLPFKGSQDTFYVFRRMLETATSYPYGSANAFNLIALLGGNWVPDSTVVLGLSIKQWGILGILLSFAFVLVLAVRARKRGTLSLPLLAALFLTLVFTLGHNMHERYLFPALFLLLLALAEIRDRRLLTAHHALSAALFLNAGAVLLCVFNGKFNLIGEMDNAVRLFSLLGVSAAGYFAYVCWRVLALGERREDALGAGETPVTAEAASPTGPVARRDEEAPLQPGEEGDAGTAEAAGEPQKGAHAGKEIAATLQTGHPAWTKRERLLLWGLTAVYAIAAFVNLGDFRAPETVFALKDGQQAVVTLPEGSRPAAVWAYANICQGKLGVYAASEGTGTLAATVDLGYDHMFRWTVTGLEGETAERFSLKAFGDCKVNEIVFVDSAGNAIAPERVSFYDGTAYVDAAEAQKAFDEQDKKPLRPSEQNGMYFDELYHARTAYEHLHGLKPYENSHPPLGKVFIMAGIAVFGMTPFGWRFAGTLFGVFMLPALYLLVRRVTKSPKWAFFAAALLAVDFMHFTQTRIATIDVFVTFFIILMYYFMFRYYELDWNEVGLKRTLFPLGMAGVCFGLGAACKWTGIYAGMGLAVILSIVLFRRVSERRRALKAGDEAAISRTEGTAKNVVLTLAFCVGAYIVVPAAIYLLSYLPYFLCAESPYDLQGVWGVQEFMFNYHSKLTATHPYESRWFTWPLSIRPIWYYQGKFLPEDVVESIVAFGNPAVWWTGAFGLVTLIVQRARRTAWDSAAATFALVGFAAQFVPWVLITRATFIYHYFPSVPFVILALTLSLMAWEKRSALGADAARLLRFVLPMAALALFIAFYPIIAGMEVPRWYASNLRWFPSWTFFI